MAKTTVVGVTIDSEKKAEAQEILKELGLSMSNAVEIYFSKIIDERGIPFQIKLPDKREQRAAAPEGKGC